MRIAIVLLASLLPATLMCQVPGGFIRGADVSFLQQIEDNGGIFYENGVPTDCLQILKDNGVNYIRLRIWNNPSGGYCNLAHTLVMARRIHAMGLNLWIDFHYSDTWADPGHQIKPAAWQGIPFAALKDSVYVYTKAVIESLRNQNTLPGIVQLGNEITGGMLWPDGRVPPDSNFTYLAALFNAGYQGVQDGKGPTDTVKVMIHLADTLSYSNAGQWSLDNMLSAGAEFDIIGISFYVWYHGPLSNLGPNLAFLANRYGKPIMIAETAYPWTLRSLDNTGNLVGFTTPLPGYYAPTVSGQKSFLQDLMTTVANTPDGRGMGVCYWEPDWITTHTFGSAWENVALFDSGGHALSSIAAFDFQPTAVKDESSGPDGFSLEQNYPNPFNPSTVISYRLTVLSEVKLEIFNAIGQHVATIEEGRQVAGEHAVTFDASRFASGVYFYRLSAAGRDGSSGILVRSMLLIK